MQKIKYWLSEHPEIVAFRWSPTQSYGSTWSFLIGAITIYIAAATTLHFLLNTLPLHLLRRGRLRPIPLGPIPAVHSLAMCLISAVIFLGTLLSAASEIRDTRWLWRRSRTNPVQWLLCFPLGTRATGRVFFWSYVFYLSRFLHLLRTFFSVLRRRRLSRLRLFNHSILIVTSFLWLEFTQSFQVLAILITTLIYSAVYAYRFWTEIGLPAVGPVFVVNCQKLLLCFNLVCHLGVLHLHLILKGGCNGIGAWICNSVLNGVILLLFLKMRFRKTKLRDELEGSVSSVHDKNDQNIVKEKYG